MNAPNPLPADKRDAERKAYEPSMEEILASIRRIIADDQAFTPRQSLPPRSQNEPKGVSEPRPPFNRPLPKERGRDRLPPLPSFPNGTPPFKGPHVPSAPAAEPIAAPDLAPPGHFNADWARETVETRETVPPSYREPTYKEPSMAAAEAAALEPPLVSPQTDAAVSSAFNTLIASQLLPAGDDLEAMIREMLRPMLKAWLDDNLPVVVERLVRAEIERVARGGR